MKFVYVAGPYTAPTKWDIEQNIRRAEATGRAVAIAGAFPVCPHTTTRFYGEEQPETFWYEATMDLLRRCDAVMLVTGWQNSRGSVRERAEALAMGLPVFDADIGALRHWLESFVGERRTA